MENRLSESIKSGIHQGLKAETSYEKCQNVFEFPMGVVRKQ